LEQRPQDTRTRAAKFFRVDGIPILFESWSGDGVRGSTAVFLTETVAGMTDATLQKLLTDRGVDLGGGATIARRQTHTFVNFGFEAK
jgi:hypothetical protein